jgi:hypothetical protein
MLGDWALTKWLRIIALLSTMVLAAAAAISVLSLLPDTASGLNDDPTPRPHPLGHNEGYGNEEVTDFFYPQQFFCTDEASDDLDGPGHNGDGLIAAQDPDEFQEPSVGPPGSPCIVGKTARGSLPTIDPTGQPVANAAPVWAILPFFDGPEQKGGRGPRNGVLDVVDPAPAVNVQCPEQGPPFTQHTGTFGTCAMHPSTLHVEPVTGTLFNGVALPGPHIPLPNHSHIVRNSDVERDPIWWLVISVRVDDPRIWPDADGKCLANPQGGEPCLTSLEALREAQQRGQAGPDTPTNLWLFFSSHKVSGVR